MFYKSKVTGYGNRVGRDGDSVLGFMDAVNVDLGFIGSEETIKLADVGIGLSEDFGLVVGIHGDQDVFP